ncbi:MAG: tetratricopeptide repeat protein, partial [Helicobacteraceae bacterium]|jgi:tetratricopeptide (TPR) repeat protein|nr:tetratricopeptide repeat protein [Helicobacteraceae bacterium]
MKTEVKNERRFMDGNNFAIELTIASTLDTDTINEQIANILKSQENLKAINSLQKQNEALLKRLAELEKQNANAKTDEQKELVRQEYAAAKDQAETIAYIKKTLTVIAERIDETNRQRAIDYYEQGEEAYKFAIDNTSGYIKMTDEALYRKGMNQFNAAIALYTKALKANPNMDEAYISRGYAYWSLSQREKTIEDFNRAIEIRPSGKNYMIRAEAHATFGKDNAALKDYEKALELEPNQPNIYLNRANKVYALRLQYKSAAKDLVKACELGKCDDLFTILGFSSEYLHSDSEAMAAVVGLFGERFKSAIKASLREITKEARAACESGDCDRLNLLRERGILLD